MSNDSIDTPEAVLTFWREAGPDCWFIKDDAFDDSIREKFLATYEAAAAGKLSAWEATAEGALALVIVLDQFPRNMFRGDARTYAADPLARAARTLRSSAATIRTCRKQSAVFCSCPSCIRRTWTTRIAASSFIARRATTI